MASLWIRSGCDMKVDPSVETYQVGARFKTLNEAVLMALAKILENLFSISSLSAAQCMHFTLKPSYSKWCQK